MDNEHKDRERWFHTQPDDTPRLRRRFPNFVSGFPETEHEILSEQQFHKIDWIANISKQKDFYRFSQNDMGGCYPGSKLALMVELNEGKNFFVIGYIKSKEKIEWLPEWKRKT